MRLVLRLPAVLVLAAACGGGGGVGGSQIAEPVRLAAGDLELAPAANGIDLDVRLATVPDPGPSLLEVAVDLPPQLTLAASSRLTPARALPTLDGDYVGNRFVVLCGDAQNAAASPLTPGPLFRLRLVPSLPRQPGTYTLRLQDLRAATHDGEAAPAAGEPTLVSVTIR